MKIAVDIDGVLGDVVSSALPRLNKEFGADYEKSDVTEWNFPVNGVSIGAHLKRYFADPVFLLTVPVIEHSKRVINYLMKDHEAVIVTGRPGYAKRYTYMWLVDNFRFNNVIFTSDKTVQKTGCDVLIDDHRGYLNKFRASGGKTIQFVQPWNQNYLSDNSVESWIEIPDMIEEMVSIS